MQVWKLVFFHCSLFSPSLRICACVYLCAYIHEIYVHILPAQVTFEPWNINLHLGLSFTSKSLNSLATCSWLDKSRVSAIAKLMKFTVASVHRQIVNFLHTHEKGPLLQVIILAFPLFPFDRVAWLPLKRNRRKVWHRFPDSCLWGTIYFRLPLSQVDLRDLLRRSADREEVMCLRAWQQPSTQLLMDHFSDRVPEVFLFRSACPFFIGVADGQKVCVWGKSRLFCFPHNQLFGEYSRNRKSQLWSQFRQSNSQLTWEDVACLLEPLCFLANMELFEMRLFTVGSTCLSGYLMSNQALRDSSVNL